MGAGNPEHLTGLEVERPSAPPPNPPTLGSTDVPTLCSLPYGRERDDAFADAFKKYGIVAPENVQDKAKAEYLVMIPLDCAPPPATPSDIADQGVSKMDQLKR